MKINLSKLEVLRFKKPNGEELEIKKDELKLASMHTVNGMQYVTIELN